MKSLINIAGALALGTAALLATPAAQADTIPEDAVVLSCKEVFGYFDVEIFHNGTIYHVFSETCPLYP